MTIAGQVGIVHNSDGFFGKLVEDVTRSTAYHVVTAISETECVSPEREGALRRPISHFRDVTWTDLDYTDAQRASVVAWAEARIGKPYSWTDDAIIGVSRITGWPIPRRVALWMSNDRAYMCSEFAACAVFYGAGIRVFPGLYPGEVAPGDWDDFVKAKSKSTAKETS